MCLVRVLLLLQTATRHFDFYSQTLIFSFPSRFFVSIPFSSSVFVFLTFFSRIIIFFVFLPFFYLLFSHFTSPTSKPSFIKSFHCFFPLSFPLPFSFEEVSHEACATKFHIICFCSLFLIFFFPLFFYLNNLFFRPSLFFLLFFLIFLGQLPSLHVFYFSNPFTVYSILFSPIFLSHTLFFFAPHLPLLHLLFFIIK